MKRTIIPFILATLAVLLALSVGISRRFRQFKPLSVQAQPDLGLEPPPGIASVPRILPIESFIPSSHSCHLRGDENPIDEAMIARMESAVQEGWRDFLASSYVKGLRGPWDRSSCEECRAEAVRLLLSFNNLDDPVCEILRGPWYFGDLEQSPEIKNRLEQTAPVFSPPQTASEARALIQVAMASPDRAAAYQIGQLIGSEHFFPAGDVAPEILDAWFGASQPVIRSLFAYMVESQLIQKAAPEWCERIAEGLLDRWDLEAAEGVRVQNLQVAGRLLGSDVELSDALAGRLRERLFREFQTNYDLGNDSSRNAAADVILNTPLARIHREAQLPWLERVLAEPADVMKKRYAILFFTHHRLRLEADDEQHEAGRRYADRLIRILMNSFPAYGNPSQLTWIKSIQYADSTEGRAFLKSLRPNDPESREIIRREFLRN